MENKMVKAILVMEDGSQKEFEGKGMVICAATVDNDEINTQGCVHGKFSLASIVGIHEMMAKSFEDDWAKAGIFHSMKCIQGMMGKGTESDASPAE